MIDIENIVCFYVIEKAVFAYTSQKERYAIDCSLDDLSKKLKPDQFFRINRQHMINISAISNMYSLSNRTIKIELNPAFDQETIVSLLRLSEFKKWINQ
jgi:DNA-binding LytR/AlgR family response regulator